MLEAGFYNMDCMDAMREFPDKFFDLAIVDPPYGIGEDGRKRDSRIIPSATWRNPIANNYHIANWDNERPSEQYFNELFRVSKNQIIWGFNHFIDFLSPTSSVVVWDKRASGDFSDCEIAWTSHKKAIRKFEWLWDGFKKQKPEDRIHPTQKPIALYTWLLQNYAHRGDKILDTHVGSASSLIACHRMGFEYWGYELDQDYFKAASERLAREKATTPLFEPQEIYKQEGLSFDL